MFKQEMGPQILAKRHLLTDMWRHASAEGRSVYCLQPHHTTLWPKQLLTSTPTVAPNTHLFIP